MSRPSGASIGSSSSWLKRVPEFAGVYAEYHNFRKKALTFFADCPGLRDLLRDLEKSSKTFDANGYYYTELQAKYTGLNVKEISSQFTQVTQVTITPTPFRSRRFTRLTRRVADTVRVTKREGQRRCQIRYYNMQ